MTLTFLRYRTAATAISLFAFAASLGFTPAQADPTPECNAGAAPDSLECGEDASATNEDATAVGDQAQATGLRSTAVGSSSIASGTGAVATGTATSVALAR